MKIRNSRLGDFLNVLVGLKRIQSTRFAYAIARNRREIEKEKEILDEIIKEKLARRGELVKKYCRRDENGELLVENGEYRFGNNLQAFEEEWKPIQAEIDDYLREEVEIKEYRIRADLIPSSLTEEEMYFLMDLIDGDILNQQETKHGQKTND